MRGQPGQKVFVEVARLFVVVLLTAAGYELGRSHPGWLPGSAGPPNSTAFVGALLGTCVGYVVGGVLGRVLNRAFGVAEEHIDHTPAAAMAAGTIGAAAGLGIAVLAAIPVLLLDPAPWVAAVTGLIAWILATLGYRLARHKSDELLAVVGLTRRFAPRYSGSPAGSARAVHEAGVLLDSSAVIDGRLLGLARAGFLDDTLLLPRFVLEEIQAIADAADPRRRRRGRRGLEILDALQGEAELVVLDDELPEIETVDGKLVQLARRLPAALLTTDFNLQKVAELQGVPVRNVNRLAEAVRPPYVAGDVVHLRIEAVGRDEGQGVGYTDDGAMVVVAGAARAIGEAVDVVVSSAHQTTAGRMFFASLKAPGRDDRDPIQTQVHVATGLETPSGEGLTVR